MRQDPSVSPSLYFTFFNPFKASHGLVSCDWGLLLVSLWAAVGFLSITREIPRQTGDQN